MSTIADLGRLPGGVIGGFTSASSVCCVGVAADAGRAASQTRLSLRDMFGALSTAATRLEALSGRTHIVHVSRAVSLRGDPPFQQSAYATGHCARCVKAEALLATGAALTAL
jgi:hypothetical protein